MPIAPAVLRQINDAIFDIQSSDYNSFDKHIKKLARLLHASELEPLTRNLIADIDLDAWLRAGQATRGGMVGSAALEWPPELEKELGLEILLIDRFADKGVRYAISFAHTFYNNGRNVNDNLHKMTRELLIPFARDYINHIKAKTEEWITAAEALRLLKPAFNSDYIAQKAICKRAHHA